MSDDEKLYKLTEKEFKFLLDSYNRSITNQANFNNKIEQSIENLKSKLQHFEDQQGVLNNSFVEGVRFKELEERLNKAEYKLNRIVIDDKSETSQVHLFNIIRRQNDIMGRLKSLESKVNIINNIDTASLKAYKIGDDLKKLEERIANLESKELKSMQYSCQCIDDYQKMKNEEMEKGVAPQQDGALDKCDCNYCQDGTPPYKEEPPPLWKTDQQLWKDNKKWFTDFLLEFGSIIELYKTKPYPIFVNRMLKFAEKNMKQIMEYLYPSQEND